MPGFGALMREGKSNYTERVEYAATIRHKEYKLCAFGALAFCYFYRWQLMGELFPNLQRNEFWFDINVLKGKKSLTDEIDYSTQYKSLCKSFDVCGINSIRKNSCRKRLWCPPCRNCWCKRRSVEKTWSLECPKHREQSFDKSSSTIHPRNKWFSWCRWTILATKSFYCARRKFKNKIFSMVGAILDQVQTG